MSWIKKLLSGVDWEESKEVKQEIDNFQALKPEKQVELLNRVVDEADKAYSQRKPSADLTKLERWIRGHMTDAAKELLRRK